VRLVESRGICRGYWEFLGWRVLSTKIDGLAVLELGYGVLGIQPQWKGHKSAVGLLHPLDSEHHIHRCRLLPSSLRLGDRYHN
jgi:hypothetical protein